MRIEIIRKKIDTLLKILESEKILVFIRNNPRFFDEPNFTCYTGELDNSLQFLDLKPADYYKSEIDEATSHSLSFFSKESAIESCLERLADKLAVHVYPKKKILHSKYSDLTKKALDPSLYLDGTFAKDIKLGWINGLNLSRSVETLIPAHLFYRHHFNEFNKSSKKNGQKKIVPIDTGFTNIAGGFDTNQALLNGIYDVVEKDAAMSAFLLKYKPERINVKTVKSQEAQLIEKKSKKYGFEWSLFNITNDLKIPVFLSLLIDRSLSGPVISVGVKAGFNVSEAIIGSVEKAYLFQFLGRSEMYYHTTHNSKISSHDIVSSIDKRILYWSQEKMLKQIDFLLSQHETKFKTRELSYSVEKQLSEVRSRIEEKGYEVYCADITVDIFREVDYHTIGVLIPGLQPFYLDERKKELKLERLKKVSEFFNQKKLEINTTPHFYI